MFISGGAAALIAGIHLIGRWWHLGWGGLQLPSFAAWLNFQDSPTAMAMLLAEQWGALLAVWVGMFALLVMAAGWGLSRVGDPGRSPHWQIILGEACGMVFALAATVLSLVGMVISRNQNLLLVGIPLGFVLLPWFIGGIGLAVISGRGIYVVRQLRRSQRQTAQRQTTQRQAARKGSQTSPQQTPPKQPPPQQGQAPRISPQKKNQGGNR